MEKPFAILNKSVEDLPIEKQQEIILEFANQIQVDPEDISDGYHTFYELYQFRKLYNASLFNEWAKQLGETKYTEVGIFNKTLHYPMYKVHKSWRHSNGELCFGGGWFVVVAELPTGQITNHYEEKDWHLFQIPEYEKVQIDYDGHTSEEARERLYKFLESTVTRRKG